MGPNWISKIERRLNFITVPGLASFLIAMNVAVGLLSLFKPIFPEKLILDPFLIGQGEIWRVLTFLFVPPSMAPLWLALWLILFYAYLRRLEFVWGDFRLTIYCLIGVLGLVTAAFLTRSVLSNGLFYTSLFLAFTRLEPDFEVLFLFVLPVKMRWLFRITVFLVLWSFLFGSWPDRAANALGFANYLIFFWPEHWRDLKQAWRRRRY